MKYLQNYIDFISVKTSISKNTIFYLLLFGAFTHILCAIFNVGYNHPDEHFQILEFAWHKLGYSSASDLAWEFKVQERQTIQPWIIVWIINIQHFFGSVNPFYIATFTRLLSSFLFFIVSLWFLSEIFQKVEQKIVARYIFLFSMLIWFVPYIHSRFSQETWGGLFLTIGFIYFLRNNNNFSNQALSIAGICWGLAFVFRFQIALGFVGVFLWMIFQKKPIKAYFILGSSFVLSILVFGVFLDYLFYGQWVFTPWIYFDYQILRGTANSFGTMSVWGYLEIFILQGIPPISAILLVFFFIGCVYKWKNSEVWLCISFILGHSLIGHKENRFLFPLIMFLPVYCAYGIYYLQQIKSEYKKIIYHPVLIFLSKIAITVNFLMIIIVCLKPANEGALVLNYLYKLKSGSVVYTLENSPYKWVGLEINFYKNRKLSLQKINSKIKNSMLNTSVDNYLFLEKNEINNSMLDKNIESKLVFASLPEWLKHFNFNNWMSRARVWRLYKLTLKKQ